MGRSGDWRRGGGGAGPGDAGGGRRCGCCRAGGRRGRGDVGPAHAVSAPLPPQGCRGTPEGCPASCAAGCCRPPGPASAAARSAPRSCRAHPSCRSAGGAAARGPRESGPARGPGQRLGATRVFVETCAELRPRTQRCCGEPASSPCFSWEPRAQHPRARSGPSGPSGEGSSPDPRQTLVRSFPRSSDESRRRPGSLHPVSSHLVPSAGAEGALGVGPSEPFALGLPGARMVSGPCGRAALGT